MYFTVFSSFCYIVDGYSIWSLPILVPLEELAQACSVASIEILAPLGIILVHHYLG